MIRSGNTSPAFLGRAFSLDFWPLPCCTNTVLALSINSGYLLNVTVHAEHEPVASLRVGLGGGSLEFNVPSVDLDPKIRLIEFLNILI
jgi:hypothetical protein